MNVNPHEDSPVRLFESPMNDGSRAFMDLPTDVIGWGALYRYLGKLDGVTKTGFLTDRITEVWMDFTYRGHSFSVNTVMGEYWFFVDDPECPREILKEIADHCAQLFEK